MSGLLPICAHCKKIRDDQGYWTQVESYIGQRAHVSFSHGICPDCLANIVNPEMGNPLAECPSNEVVDVASVLARVDGDLDVLREMSMAFLNSSPRLLSNAQNALRCGDAKSLETAAHALKSSVINFAARAAVGAALKLERIARQGDLQEAESASRAVEEEVGRVRLALADLGWAG